MARDPRDAGSGSGSAHPSPSASSRRARGASPSRRRTAWRSTVADEARPGLLFFAQPDQVLRGEGLRVGVLRIFVLDVVGPDPENLVFAVLCNQRLQSSADAAAVRLSHA